uniref:Uncharacterized protein n=1 Tax=Anopheles dirus TaxID=7168 RepID=A0A182NXV0_9DIPT
CVLSGSTSVGHWRRWSVYTTTTTAACKRSISTLVKPWLARASSLDGVVLRDLLLPPRVCCVSVFRSLNGDDVTRT